MTTAGRLDQVVVDQLGPVMADHLDRLVSEASRRIEEATAAGAGDTPEARSLRETLVEFDSRRLIAVAEVVTLSTLTVWRPGEPEVETSWVSRRPVGPVDDGGRP